MSRHSTRNVLLAAAAACATTLGGAGVAVAVHASEAGANGAHSHVAPAPAVDVRLSSSLAQHTSSHKERLQVAFRSGLTPGAIAAGQGLTGQQLYGIMAVVNGVQADFITPLAPGDHVELMLATAGG